MCTIGDIITGIFRYLTEPVLVPKTWQDEMKDILKKLGIQYWYGEYTNVLLIQSITREPAQIDEKYPKLPNAIYDFEIMGLICNFFPKLDKLLICECLLVITSTDYFLQLLKYPVMIKSKCIFDGDSDEKLLKLIDDTLKDLTPMKGKIMPVITDGKREGFNTSSDLGCFKNGMSIDAFAERTSLLFKKHGVLKMEQEF